MQQNELILLDARLVGVLDDAVYQAVLSNGHTLTALGKDRKGRCVGRLEIGDTVKVALSPFDMSRGRIVLSMVSPDEVDDEGEKLGA
jgi:translation initiation factor IF-1